MAIDQNIRLTVDVVLFGITKDGVDVLLIQRKDGSWALPGGFVDDREELKKAAVREMEEETGVKLANVIQFYTFGDDINRDPRGHTVSVAHLAVKVKDTIEVKAASDAKAAKWVNIHAVPNLAFDHNKIIDVAKNHLKMTLQYELQDFKVLEKEITSNQLDHVNQYLSKH